MLTTLDNVNYFTTFDNLEYCSFAFAPHVRSDHEAFSAVGLHNGGIALFTRAALRLGEFCSELRGLEYTVIFLAFSNSCSEQQMLASISLEDIVQLWDIQTKECIATFKGHTAPITSVAFSPDDRLLASASHDHTVLLWDVVERKAASPVHVLQGHTDWVWRVSFSPDGRQLASGSYDRTVRLWSVPEGMPGPVLQHTSFVDCSAFSPVVGSNMLATSGESGIIRLWDVSGINSQLLRKLQGSDLIISIAFSPDGSQLVSGSWEKTVQLWNVASGQLLKSLKGHSDIVRSVAFHPNGKQVASCARGDNTVRIWTVCEWSDRTHQLFGEELKRLVFCLMCIKEKIEKHKPIVPNLSMALWLDIFNCL
jgi:WD40 repeat protein